MEKRIIGIVLTLLGIAGLIIAGTRFMNNSGPGRGIREIIMYGILGLIFFFSGIALLKNTSSKPT